MYTRRPWIKLVSVLRSRSGSPWPRAFWRRDWRLAILFGALVIVTGPTVVTPLLRRVRVKRSVQTVHEADRVWFAIDGTRSEAAEQLLAERGWVADPTPDATP